MSFLIRAKKWVEEDVGVDAGTLESALYNLNIKSQMLDGKVRSAEEIADIEMAAQYIQEQCVLVSQDQSKSSHILSEDLDAEPQPEESVAGLDFGLLGDGIPVLPPLAPGEGDALLKELLEAGMLFKANLSAIDGAK